MKYKFTLFEIIFTKSIISVYLYMKGNEDWWLNVTLTKATTDVINFCFIINKICGWYDKRRGTQFIIKSCIHIQHVVWIKKIKFWNRGWFYPSINICKFDWGEIWNLKVNKCLLKKKKESVESWMNLRVWKTRADLKFI